MKRAIFGKKKGFTLLELLIVVVVLAILAGLALPQYFRVITRSKEAEGWEMMAAIRSAEMRYYAEWEAIDPPASKLDITNPNDVGLFPNAFFTYAVTDQKLGKFEITATKTLKCPGCKNLKLDSAGTRTEF